SSQSWSRLRATAYSAAPAAVSSTWRRSRRNSWARSVVSRPRICLLRAGCDRCRRSAARVKLSSSATATKYRRSRRWASIANSYHSLSWTDGLPATNDQLKGTRPTRAPRISAARREMAGPVVHTYRAAESGLYVNSYLVEGESGVVVVDTNLLVSDIEALRARLRALKKPLLGILVTHAHPDHFNGVLALVQDKEVPVYATAGVGRAIEEIADAKRAQWSPVYGAEWPAETYYPNSL